MCLRSSTNSEAHMTGMYQILKVLAIIDFIKETVSFSYIPNFLYVCRLGWCFLLFVTFQPFCGAEWPMM